MLVVHRGRRRIYRLRRPVHEQSYISTFVLADVCGKSSEELMEDRFIAAQTHTQDLTVRNFTEYILRPVRRHILGGNDNHVYGNSANLYKFSNETFCADVLEMCCSRRDRDHVIVSPNSCRYLAHSLLQMLGKDSSWLENDNLFLPPQTTYNSKIKSYIFEIMHILQQAIDHNLYWCLVYLKQNKK